LVRFGSSFLEQKPVQTGFGSVFSGFGSVFSSFDPVFLFWLGFFFRFFSVWVRFGFFGYKTETETEPNRLVFSKF
jgi:hypothetical protein